MRNLMNAVAIIGLMGFSSTVLAGEISVFIENPHHDGPVAAPEDNPLGIGPDVEIATEFGDGNKDIGVNGPQGVDNDNDNTHPEDHSPVENSVEVSISPGTPF